MPRNRPIAGQRSRSRLGGLDPAPKFPPPAIEPPIPTPTSPTAADPLTPAPTPRRVGSARRVGGAAVRDPWVLVAGPLVLVLAATAGLLQVRARSEDRAEQARSAAQAAAESHAVTVLSYDHRHLDRDFRRARAVLTGRFAADYAKTTEKVVRPTAEEVKAVVTADVAASSVVRGDEDRVVVLLFVDQTTTSTRLDGPKVDLNRVRMTLRRDAGEWLVSGVDAL